MGLKCKCLPSGTEFIKYYKKVDYSIRPEVVWGKIGGKIEKTYGLAGLNGMQQTCAARLRHALNESGASIAKGPAAYRNSGGLGNNPGKYIISARELKKYVRNTYGKSIDSVSTYEEVATLKNSFADGQLALVLSNGHASVLTKDYQNPYIHEGDVWILPTGKCSCK